MFGESDIEHYIKNITLSFGLGSRPETKLLGLTRKSKSTSRNRLSEAKLLTIDDLTENIFACLFSAYNTISSARHVLSLFISVLNNLVHKFCTIEANGKISDNCRSQSKQTQEV